jgi:nondiscriminating glutamyl-tRNA synthetase
MASDVTNEAGASLVPAPVAESAPPTNSFGPADIAEILHEKGWLPVGALSSAEEDAALQAWLARASDLLGPQAQDRATLAQLLRLIFEFDAAAALATPENHNVLAREGARDVIRELANRILEGGDVDSDRFKEIVESMKQAVPWRSRAMFHPIRLALTGRAGEGELDRVILLLDGAAKLLFAASVKGTRQRILEFCAALD